MMRASRELLGSTGSRAWRVARRARDSLRRLASEPPHPSDSRPTPPTRVDGMVEQFSSRLAVGWISVPEQTAPVKVTLHLGALQVAHTYATSGAAMSGSDSVLRGEAAPPVDGTASTQLIHPWQRPNLPSPPDDRRNSKRQIRTFSFRYRGLWRYAKRTSKVTIRVKGHPLPIYGHGMYLTPPSDGKRSVKHLRAKFEQGYLFSQTGNLQLSKSLDETWQRHVMEMYQLVRRVLSQGLDYDVFFVYGTLLGAVREGGYIAHDIDFDAAYVSKHTSGRDAARELADIGLLLIEKGLDVRCMGTALHIHDRQDPSTRIDLFHVYFDAEGTLCFPFGVAGTNVVRREDWRGTRETDFPGGRGLVPANAEEVVAALYGDDWRRPKPGFNWRIDRTARAEEGILSVEEREEVYWANFYARVEYADGSMFCAFVTAQPDLPRRVLDIGCGDGRDSCAFGVDGREVVGVDRSDVGITHARLHANAAGVAEGVTFGVCDVGEPEALERLFTSHIPDGEPVMFYLRFFLHSIPVDVQETLLRSISDHARPGDVFAAEFRTDRDQENAKVHGQHYRRFQNAAEFAARLRDDYGFTPVHEEEATGLSPYQGEDPVLYRVIARR